MNTFAGLEDESGVTIYPRLIRAGRKRLSLLILGSLLFILYGLFDIVTGHNQALGWQAFLFFGLCFFIFILQFSWGPMLTIKEQMLSLRPNPFLKRIDLRWEEIASIRISGKRYLFLDIIPATIHIDTFLQRQSPFMKNVLIKRIEHTGRIAHFSRWHLSGTLSLSLLYLIQNRYHQQIKQYCITLLNESE